MQWGVTVTLLCGAAAYFAAAVVAITRKSQVPDGQRAEAVLQDSF
jgi:hypothetical protein